MSMHIDESYNDRTMLPDYWRITKQNIRAIADELNLQQYEIDELGLGVDELNNTSLPQRIEEIAVNEADIKKLTALADIIITESNGNAEIRFQKPIPEVKYIIYSGGVAIREGLLDMSSATVVSSSKIIGSALNIYFYADDEKIGIATAEITEIAGLKAAFITVV